MKSERHTKNQIVYIFDKRCWREILAELESVRSQENSNEIRYDHTLTFLSVCPLGQMLAEAVSIDVENLRKQIDLKEKAIPALPAPFDCIDVRDAKEYLCALNCIAATREFIDLCNVDPIMNGVAWMHTFYNILGIWNFLPNDRIHLILHEMYPLSEWYEAHKEDRDSNTDLFDLGSQDFDITELRYHLSRYADTVTEDILLDGSYHSWGLRILSPMSLLFSSLEHCRDNGIQIVKCGNCGLYFSPKNRSDTKYCDRQAPQDSSKTCKEYGARTAWERTLQEDQAAGLYRKIYMAKQMLVKRNPDNMGFQQSFEKYKAQSKQWKADVKSGAKTEDEYIAWLKDVKEKRVL